MGHLLDGLGRAYWTLGLVDVADGDEVFPQLVLAEIIEPASKLDSLRVLQEAWLAPPPYATFRRRLPAENPCQDSTPIKVLAISSADRVACLMEIRYASK